MRLLQALLAAAIAVALELSRGSTEEADAKERLSKPNEKSLLSAIIGDENESEWRVSGV